MRVRRFIVERRLVEAGERLLVGVSGGPDSTCLLVTLAALQRSLGIDLHAAYFDHGLRGKRAAAREERFVRSLAGELDVPLHCGSGDVRAHAASKRRSIEEAARELRYRFFARIAADAGCGAVATGHTKDDQAETVLLHLVRGSGLRGLAAMSPSSPWPWPLRATEPPRLIRPLLAVTREETEACCRQAEIEPIQDPSNRSRAHLRNRIRSELTPLLRRYNPRIDDALARLADSAAADIELLEALAADALTPDEGTAGPIRIARKRLAALPESLRRHAVRLAAARALGDARGLSDRHVRAILRAAAGPTGAQLDLPRGLHAQVTRSYVILSTGEPSAPAPLPDGVVTLAVPGSARFGPWRFQAQLTRRPAGDLLKAKAGDANVALLDAGACGPALELRRRRRGDRFHPLGMPGTKKLQDFFVDAHVPRAERDAIPLVCGDRGIAWVVTQRPAEWAKVTAKTKRVLRIHATLSPP
ncbi:MAG: tRNA lysidine(34) synthetase TilS [Chloroflexi bacterium]|nr:tRNA lysidine(34) synthetase TilS [Chloroflexota bacterium]